MEHYLFLCNFSNWQANWPLHIPGGLTLVDSSSSIASVANSVALFAVLKIWAALQSLLVVAVVDPRWLGAAAKRRNARLTFQGLFSRALRILQECSRPCIVATYQPRPEAWSAPTRPFTPTPLRGVELRRVGAGLTVIARFANACAIAFSAVVTAL